VAALQPSAITSWGWLKGLCSRAYVVGDRLLGAVGDRCDLLNTWRRSEGPIKGPSGPTSRKWCRAGAGPEGFFFRPAVGPGRATIIGVIFGHIPGAGVSHVGSNFVVSYCHAEESASPASRAFRAKGRHSRRRGRGARGRPNAPPRHRQDFRWLASGIPSIPATAILLVGRSPSNGRCSTGPLVAPGPISRCFLGRPGWPACTRPNVVLLILNTCRSWGVFVNLCAIPFTVGSWPLNSWWLSIIRCLPAVGFKGSRTSWIMALSGGRAWGYVLRSSATRDS